MNPVLQLDEFALQPKQLLEIDMAIERILAAVSRCFGKTIGAVIIEFEFEL